MKKLLCSQPEYALIGGGVIDIELSSIEMPTLEIDFKYITAPVANTAVFAGLENAGVSSPDRFYAHMASVNTVTVGKGSSGASVTLVATDRNVLRISGTSNFINGVARNSNSAVPVDTGTPMPIALMGNHIRATNAWNTSASNLNNFRLYGFKVWNAQNELIRHLIPVPSGSTVYSSTPAPSHCCWCAVQRKYYIAKNGTFGIEEVTPRKIIVAEDPKIQENPRWATIDITAGYTPIAYNDEVGVAVGDTGNYWNATACIGTRNNGIIYYGAGSESNPRALDGKIWKRTITNNVLSSPELVCTLSNRNIWAIFLNERNGAVAVVTSATGATGGATSSGSIFIAPSMEQISSATPIVSGTVGAGGIIQGFNHWISDLLLVGNKFYDTNGTAVRTLPSNVNDGTTTSKYIITGNKRDGYLILRQTAQSGGYVTLFDYDWDNNTATQLFTFAATSNTPGLSWNSYTFIDPVNKGVICPRNDGTADVVRTTDGVNFSTVPGTQQTWAAWFQNYFQHVGIFATLYNGMGSGWTGWDANTDTLIRRGSESAWPSLMNHSRIYFGTGMMINGTRIYDVIPKPDRNINYNCLFSNSYEPQWNPRWAKINLDAGYTQFTYLDETQAVISPPISNMAVACIGDRRDGAIYYAVGLNMYRRRILNFIPQPAELLWTDQPIEATTHVGLQLAINEETGACSFQYLPTGQWRSKVAPSVERAMEVNSVTTLVGIGYHNGTLWVNNKVLHGNRLYDGTNTASYQTLPTSGLSGVGIGTYSEQVLLGDSLGTFVQTGVGGQTNTDSAICEYNIEANTLTEIFRVARAGATAGAVTQRFIRDSKNNTFIGNTTVNNAGSIARTNDGVNFGSSIGTATGFWRNRLFSHIGIAWFPTTSANTNTLNGTWWRQENDVIGSVATANSLFPGYLASHFYAGKKMLINGDRLYDIVPK